MKCKRTSDFKFLANVQIRIKYNLFAFQTTGILPLALLQYISFPHLSKETITVHLIPHLLSLPPHKKGCQQRNLKPLSSTATIKACRPITSTDRKWLTKLWLLMRFHVMKYLLEVQFSSIVYILRTSAIHSYTSRRLFGTTSLYLSLQPLQLQPSRNISKHVSLTWSFPHRQQQARWLIDVTELLHCSCR